MQISLEELLKGKKTRIKGNEFLTPEVYVKPFIERMNGFTDDFVIKVVEPQQITLNRDGTEDIVYNKVSIEATIPDGMDYSETIGMVYALDTRKPLVKFFRCLKSNEFNNFIIETDNNIITQTLEPESPINFRSLDALLQKDFKTDEFLDHIKTLDFDASNDQVNYKLGQWIRFAINFYLNSEFGKIKIGTPDIITGYKDLFEDSKSDFFISLGSHSQYLKIYNALSRVIYEGKDIVNAIDKTYLLKNILSL